ncbi:MAG: 2-isopropylmalate synthase [Kiritimatiellae bacterium]|nr:2-isopropylmalate synthase [Kiritimatiellia bacterium]
MKKKDKNRIRIFDTTLRDGEQSPGASLDHREKLEIAQQLAALGVDVIEAGFPIASPGDFAAVNAIAQKVKGPSVCGLARCVNADIERCAEAVAPAKKPRIHVFLATSAIHRKFKLRKARAEIIKQAVASVTYARKFCKDVEFSPEDASRTESDFLAQVVEAAIDAGAGTINIPDTVGYSVPEEFGAVIARLYDSVPNIDDAVISVHCHNDLGLAVSNSLAAAVSGARQIECTINGLGERAGNAALEEIVMALKTRSDQFDDLYTGINLKKIVPVSRLVSRLTGMPVQRNKAIVGANAFSHSSGVHQDGVIKKRATYEIIDPADVGLHDGAELVLSKLSGKNGLRQALTRVGISLNDDELASAYERFIALADKKKVVYDDDLIMIASEQMEDTHNLYTLDYLHVSAGTGTVPTATVRVCKGDELLQDAACGDGPVDAALKTIDRLTEVQGRLIDFSLQAVTIGKDAMGEVSLRVAFGDSVVSAKAASTDIVEAGAKAYLSCVNRHLCKQSEADETAAQLRKATRKKATRKKAVRKRAAVKPSAKKKAPARKRK